MRQQPPQKFTVSIPVKPYVKRFIEINYGMPADFTEDPHIHKFFQELLRKPDSSYDKKYPDTICTYTTETEVLISEHDFYRYGWELTKTNIVAFGRRFEDRAKAMMRSIIGVNIGLGLPINKSIEKFQDRFQFHEDIWKYEAIKKDFYRNGQVELVDFDNEIFRKIEKIILRNLYDLGTISNKAKKHYEYN
jgi:hypothetical protein